MDDELIQRFFETTFFFFKNFNFSYDDYLKKELNISLKCAVQINVQRENSFKLDLGDLIVEDEKSCPNEKVLKNNNNGNTIFNSNEYDYIYSKCEIDKLLDFKLNLLPYDDYIKEHSKTLITSRVKKEFTYNDFFIAENQNNSRELTNIYPVFNQNIKNSLDDNDFLLSKLNIEEISK